MFTSIEFTKLRYGKLIFHSILVVIVLTIFSLLTADILQWVTGWEFIASNHLIIVLAGIWFILAITSQSYTKD